MATLFRALEDVRLLLNGISGFTYQKQCRSGQNKLAALTALRHQPMLLPTYSVTSRRLSSYPLAVAVTLSVLETELANCFRTTQTLSWRLQIAASCTAAITSYTRSGFTFTSIGCVSPRQGSRFPPKFPTAAYRAI